MYVYQEEAVWGEVDTFMAASMLPKGRHTPAGVWKPASAATCASCAHAAALAPQVLVANFSGRSTFTLSTCAWITSL